MAKGRTFVGFGFGPIQSGLFVFEAQNSGNFSRYVIAEVDAAMVEAVRANGGRCNVNIARKERVDCRELSGVELYNPAVEADHERLVEAIAESEEMATALPSVKFYGGSQASPAKLMAEGLARRSRPLPTVIYTAENHNHAAELLTEAVAAAGTPLPKEVQALNTVIGKMSGVIKDAETIAQMKLALVAPTLKRAMLVEEFNRIYVSRVTVPGYRRGIECFIEKDDLLPFEEAKLYGHNAVHSLIAYLADLKGYETVADAGRDEWIMSVARDAFIKESGGALIARYGKSGEAIFTEAGYRQYALDLRDRMTRPTLHDLVSRVGRDHVRKLAYDDRFFGTMRMALDAGIEPVNFALGAAAAALSMVKRRAELPRIPSNLPESAAAFTREGLEALLREIWGKNADTRAQRLVDLTWNALERLR